MSDQLNPDPTENQPSSFSREDAQTMINGALGTHAKRVEKMITEAVAKALSSVPQPAPAPIEEPKGKDSKDAKQAELERRLADMQRRLEESDRARRDEADARRRTETRGAVRSQLEAKNVRKELLDLALDAMMANGTIRFDEDGRAVMSVKRSRSKGASAEEQIFDDLASGVADWVQTDIAAALIKAPVPATKPQFPGGQNGQPRTGSPQFSVNDSNRSESVLALIDSTLNK